MNWTEAIVWAAGIACIGFPVVAAACIIAVLWFADRVLK